MSFVTTVKGDRLNAGYSSDSAVEAVRKAETCIALGEVTITDPHNEDWKPEHFPVLLQRWAKAHRAD